MSGRPSLYAYTWLAARRPRGIAALAGGIMHAAGHAFLAGAAGLLVRSLADGGRVGTMDVGSTGLVWIATAGLCAALSKLAGGALAAWAEARIASDVSGRVRLAVLDDVLALGREDPSVGHRLAALTTHVHDVEAGVQTGVLAEVRAVLQLAPLVILLVLLAPGLAGSAVLSLVGFGVFARVVRRGLKRAHARATVSAGALVSAADEAVKHAELWATYGARTRIRSHVEKIGVAIAHEAGRLRVRASLLSSTSEVLGALALLLLVVLASRGILTVDASSLVPFAIVFFMAYRPLRDLVDARLARGRAEEALAAALPRPPVTVVPEASSTPVWPLERLVLEDLRTGYGGHSPLTLRLQPGTIAVIVGPTGIGKTSILRALLGLDPAASGEVKYGGRRLHAAGVGPAERPFAWVPQDAPVIGDTLAANVALGREGVDAAAVLADLGAARLADSLGDDILAPGRVSGGERQWIAMARALATGLPVLLLDEPTSALDGASQARLLEAIARLRGKRTVLLVTHRPEPLAIADVVVELVPGVVRLTA